MDESEAELNAGRGGGGFKPAMNAGPKRAAESEAATEGCVLWSGAEADAEAAEAVAGCVGLQFGLGQ